MLSHEHFMKIALQEAKLAYDEGEIPVGAVIVCEETIIAKAHNQTERLKDFTAHAEMLAYTSASEYLGGKYLSDCTLYVTLEPCVMCAGASYWTQLGAIVYAAKDKKRGFSVLEKSIIHPKTKIIQGILEKEASELMQRFFLSLRNNP
jgi:tRNA(adenine34) deaminase